MKMIMILGCLLQDTPILSSYLADKEKYTFLKAEYKSTIFAAYKMRKSGKTILLKFQNKWCLAYSLSQGGGYCKYCGLFSHASTRSDTILKDENYNAISDQNKHILLVTVEGIKLCRMQRLPLRGHRDDNTAHSCTNHPVTREQYLKKCMTSQKTN